MLLYLCFPVSENFLFYGFFWPIKLWDFVDYYFRRLGRRFFLFGYLCSGSQSPPPFTPIQTGDNGQKNYYDDKHAAFARRRYGNFVVFFLVFHIVLF